LSTASERNLISKHSVPNLRKVYSESDEMQIFETPHDCWTDVHIALNEVIVYTETYGDVELDLSY
jgi:hypothetical protein